MPCPTNKNDAFKRSNGLTNSQMLGMQKNLQNLLPRRNFNLSFGAGFLLTLQRQLIKYRNTNTQMLWKY